MSKYVLISGLRGARFVIASAICSGVLIAAEQTPADPHASVPSAKPHVSNAQLTARDVRGTSTMVPVANEPPPKLFLDTPLPQTLARGMILIQFRTENLHVVPIFGLNAVNVSPRIGHLHVRVDDTPWVWSHTNGDDLIINRLVAGPHKIHVELVDANHQVLSKGTVECEVPQGPHTANFPHEHDLIPDVTSKDEPTAKIFVDPPQPDKLAHGVAFIRYRTENALVAPVFGTTALDVSPRICHLHVTVNDARWRWAHTSSGPLILGGLPPGRHKILIELVNANHKPIANNIVSFEVPESSGERQVTKASAEQTAGKQ